jgi:thioredoxin reductase (NADPH)
MLNMNTNIAIIGAGPAGLTTALQLKRYGIEATLIEKDQVGGLLRNANWVENYPGFPRGITGKKLVNLFKQQLKLAGVIVKKTSVTQLDWEDNGFRLQSDKFSMQARIVVIASGTKPLLLKSYPIPVALQGYVHYEIYHLQNEVGKIITIIGAGDAAFDYALNLSRKNEVHILNLSQEHKCLSLLYERSLQNANIHYHNNTKLHSISPCEQKNMLLECQTLSGMIKIETDYLIGAIGREPYLDYLSEQLFGKIDQLRKCQRLYLIGDVTNDWYRQASIAIGDGMMAAMKIYQQERLT